jgi:hypothetical protein
MPCHGYVPSAVDAARVNDHVRNAVPEQLERVPSVQLNIFVPPCVFGHLGREAVDSPTHLSTFAGGEGCNERHDEHYTNAMNIMMNIMTIISTK